MSLSHFDIEPSLGSTGLDEATTIPGSAPPRQYHTPLVALLPINYHHLTIIGTGC